MAKVPLSLPEELFVVRVDAKVAGVRDRSGLWPEDDSRLLLEERTVDSCCGVSSNLASWPETAGVWRTDRVTEFLRLLCTVGVLEV
jgi:hypothetical protein